MPSKSNEERIARLDALAAAAPEVRGSAFAEAQAAATDPDREIRTAAAEAIAATADPDDALRWLNRLSADEDVGVRYGAVAAIAGLPWRGRLDPLARALNDDDLGIVAVAADGLSYAGDRRAIPALLDLVNEKKLQFGALEGFYALRDESGLPTAQRIFGGLLTPFFEKAAAALLLARAGDAQALEHLRRRAVKRYGVERGFVLSHLLEVDPAEGARLLEAIAQDRNDDQRESAIVALTRADAGRWWPVAEEAIAQSTSDEAPGAGELLLALAQIDHPRAARLAETYVARGDPVGQAARRVRLAAALRETFPEEVLIRCD